MVVLYDIYQRFDTSYQQVVKMIVILQNN